MASLDANEGSLSSAHEEHLVMVQENLRFGVFDCGEQDRYNCYVPFDHSVVIQTSLDFTYFVGSQSRDEIIEPFRKT